MYKLRLKQAAQGKPYQLNEEQYGKLMKYIEELQIQEYIKPVETVCKDEKETIPKKTIKDTKRRRRTSDSESSSESASSDAVESLSVSSSSSEDTPPRRKKTVKTSKHR